ncbi:MAG: hypothetical protein HY855_05425 [Burkholderiales bacterium]|nr:hypothetical protein [Burkholderiales bacterium]
MKRRLILRGLATGPWWGAAMAAEAGLRLHTLALPALGGLRPTGVRLATDEAPRLLLADEGSGGERGFHQLLLRDITDPQPPAPTLQHRLRAALPWDARAEAAGWDLLTVHAGSAVAPLMLQPAGTGRPQALDPRGPRSLYLVPRFVAAPAAGDIVAVNHARGSAITLLRRGADGGVAARIELAPPRPGLLQQVQLLPWRDGHLLFVQTALTGGGHRRLGEPDGELQYAGRIDVHALDARGRRAGPAWAPLGGQAVFDFAVAVSGARVALLAVTATGSLLATGTPDLQGRGWGPALASPAAALASPCLQARTGGLRLAWLQGVGGDAPALQLAEQPWS